MIYPTISSKETARQMIDEFRGYNHNTSIGSGEFYDMLNMSSDYYPVLSPRKKRETMSTFLMDGIYGDNVFVTGLVSRNIPSKFGTSDEVLCYAIGSAIYIGGNRYEMDLIVDERNYTHRTRTLTSFGTYIIIMPDKKYINVLDPDDRGDIDYVWKASHVDGVADSVSFLLCDISGAEYEATVSAYAPSSPTNGQCWIDTSSVPNVLKKYSSQSGMWVNITTTYVKISRKGIGKGFKQYDGVTISGIVAEGVTDLNSSHVIWACSDDYIVVTGIIDKVVTQEDSAGIISVSRKMPIMDYIIESGNRLWGCRYGANENGDFVNEIYASKLGDFKNWNCYMSLSTDSYYVSCGTEGPFTGAVTYFGTPIFFKEHCMHKIYGDFPANFSVQQTECNGVGNGYYKTLAIIGNTLFYKSRDAICAYDGSLPVDISSQLGIYQKAGSARAGATNKKYYIMMQESATIGAKHNLFVFDTQKGVWHKESGFTAGDFCYSNNKLYCTDWDSEQIHILDGDSYNNQLIAVPEENVPWMVETGPIGMTLPDMKYISRLAVRMSLEVGSSAYVSIQYDSFGAWEQVANITATTLRSISVPIHPHRCDHFRIRIEGEGDCKIYSMTRTIEQGSDVS